MNKIFILFILLMFYKAPAYCTEQHGSRHIKINNQDIAIPYPPDAWYDADFDVLHRRTSIQPFSHGISFLIKDKERPDFKPGYTISYINPTPQSGQITKKLFYGYTQKLSAYLHTKEAKTAAIASLPPGFIIKNYSVKTNNSNKHFFAAFVRFCLNYLSGYSLA